MNLNKLCSKSEVDILKKELSVRFHLGAVLIVSTRFTQYKYTDKNDCVVK